MARVTEDDVRHLGYLARIRLQPEELSALAKEIEAVLSYAAFLAELAPTAPALNTTGTPAQNVLRDDMVQRQDPEPLLSQAPQREDDFIVVPHILSKS